MMVSVWWAVAMLLLGAYAGMLLFALVSMAAREGTQGVKDEEAVERDGVRSANLEKEWTI
jgi:hypothetical protein